MIDAGPYRTPWVPPPPPKPPGWHVRTWKRLQRWWWCDVIGDHDPGPEVHIDAEPPESIIQAIAGANGGKGWPIPGLMAEDFQRAAAELSRKLRESGAYGQVLAQFCMRCGVDCFTEIAVRVHQVKKDGRPEPTSVPSSGRPIKT